MKSAAIESVCECQARLGAQLDEERRASGGWAGDRRGRREAAPAQVLPGEGDVFHVGWSCPFCTRNSLRSFHRDSLTYSDAVPVSPSAPPVDP